MSSTPVQLASCIGVVGVLVPCPRETTSMIAQLPPSLTTPDYRDFLAVLKTKGFKGEVGTDYASRAVLATDNSIYQRLPQAC